MIRIELLGLTALLGVLIGCGGGNAQSSAAAPTPSEKADGTHLTTFQKSQLVGHYSTNDGKSGFTLDRTVDPPKARLDGDKGSMPLKASGGFDHSTEYRSDDKRIWIRVSHDGDVLLFQGPKQHQGEDVVRDADADPLK